MSTRNCTECCNSSGNANAYNLGGIQYSAGCWEDCAACAGTGIMGTKTVKLYPRDQELLRKLLNGEATKEELAELDLELRVEWNI